MEKAVIVADGVDGVSKGVNVPIVHLNAVCENLAATTLLGDYRRRATLHSLQRRDSERLADRRHDINVGILQTFVDFLASHEAWEVETVGNASLGSKINHLVHHVTAACHAETHITGAMQHHIGGLDKILRPLLHCEPTEEGHNLLLADVVGARNVL